MKNAILIDFKAEENWSFLKELGEDKWEKKEFVTNFLYGNFIKNVFRYVLFFLIPLRFVFCRKRYKKIIAWQQFYGLNFAFLCSSFHLKKTNDLTVMTFIYKKKNGIIGRLYHKYMTYVVKSKYIDRFICFSRAECSFYADMFGEDVGRFMFVPLGVSVPKIDGSEIRDEGYLFATGRSNRNYDFLIDAIKDTEYQCLIACDSYKTTDLTKNIKIEENCFGREMYIKMAHCHCVVVPLKNRSVSSGQLVVLHAMSLGKPIIGTDADGIKDYVQEGVTGFLIDNKKESLLSALHCLSEQSEYEHFSRNARECYLKNFTNEAMYKRISSIVNGND